MTNKEDLLKHLSDQENHIIDQFAKEYRLTGRQKEILSLVLSKGFSNEQLSEYLNINKKTTINHMYSMMKKLECCSSREVMSKVFNYAMSMSKKNLSS